MSHVKMALPGVEVESTSVPKGDRPNEDAIVVTPHHLAVIDGASSKAPGVLFNGKTGGEYVSLVLSQALSTLEQPLYGKALAYFLTKSLAQRLEEIGMQARFMREPEARPSGSLVVATLLPQEIILTQIGDVAFRINGREIFANPRLIDWYHAEMRVQAIENFLEKNQNATREVVLKAGRHAIERSLLNQVRNYQNKIVEPFGHGVIDGMLVPEEFVLVEYVARESLRTLEIYSDGFLEIPDEVSITAWEEAFQKAESEDPLKIGVYKDTKGSENGAFSDDRTLLIARFR